MKNINRPAMLLHFVDQSGDTLGICRIDRSHIDMVALRLETIGLLLSFRKIASAQYDLEALSSEPRGCGISHPGSGANAEKCLHGVHLSSFGALNLRHEGSQRASGQSRESCRDPF